MVCSSRQQWESYCGCQSASNSIFYYYYFIVNPHETKQKYSPSTQIHSFQMRTFTTTLKEITNKYQSIQRSLRKTKASTFMIIYSTNAQTKLQKQKEECLCSSPMQIQDHTTEGKESQIIKQLLLQEITRFSNDQLSLLHYLQCDP